MTRNPATKEKEISEDEERRGQDVIQKLTDDYVAKVESALGEKETDLMEIWESLLNWKLFCAKMNHESINQNFVDYHFTSLVTCTKTIS